MSVVNVKSTRIAGRDSIPPNKGGLTVGPRRRYDDAATVEVPNPAFVGSRFVLVSLPSSASLRDIEVLNDAIAGAAADFGIYRTTQDGGAVVDADCFGSAVSLTTANVVGTNILHESGVFDIAEIEQPLWQVLGLAADPVVMYDLVATLTAAATGAGTLTVVVSYSQAN